MEIIKIKPTSLDYLKDLQHIPTHQSSFLCEGSYLQKGLKP